MNLDSESPPKDKKKGVKSLLIPGATILCLSLASATYFTIQKNEARVRECNLRLLQMGLTPIKDRPCVAKLEKEESMQERYGKNFW